MKKYVSILPANKLDKSTLDEYIEENQLILNAMKESQNVRDFDVMAKYAERAFENLNFLWEVVNICNAYDAAVERKK